MLLNGLTLLIELMAFVMILFVLSTLSWTWACMNYQIESHDDEAAQ